MDAEDPLQGMRGEFAIPSRPDGTGAVYLCGNSLGLMPAGVPDAVNAELEDWARFAVDGHFRARTPWYSYHEIFREVGARLVGARPGEVVMMNSLTVNLHLMLTSFYRPTPGRHRVLIESHTFPSDRYALQSHAVLHGLDPHEAIVELSPREGEDGLRTDDIEGLLRERGQEMALVLLGGVNYFTGQAFQLDRITAAAHAAGCVVGIDLAHAAGNIPLALHDWDVDFAVWCSYKYLNAGPGAVAGCFVHARHGARPDLRRLAGWWGNDPARRFQMHEEQWFLPSTGAEGWQVSNPPILAMAPLRVSLEQFDRAGMAALRAKSERLTGILASQLQQIPGDRFSILTPDTPSERGCQLSVRFHRNVAQQVHRALGERGIVVDVRGPDVIRAAPVPLYNTFTDVWEFASGLRDTLAAPFTA
jgi:kynureninase